MSKLRFYQDPDFFRIQTYLLIFSFILAVTANVLPWFEITDEKGEVHSFDIKGHSQTHPNENFAQQLKEPLSIRNFLTSTNLTLIPILIGVGLAYYKKRSYVVMILALGVIFCIGVYGSSYLIQAKLLEIVEQKLKLPIPHTFSHGLAYYIPLIISPFLLASIWLIKKDEAKIKAMGRFR